MSDFSNHILAQRLIEAGADLRASIMRNQVWDSSSTKLNTLDLAKFVFCLSLFDSVDGESAFGIVDQTEVFASLVNGDDIHETGRIGNIGADFAIDLDETLHQDSIRLTAVQGILQAVSKEDDQGKAVACFLSLTLALSLILAAESRRT
jgi:hypothetical protein